MVDFAGERSLREWYDTVGKNGWRLEEFQHYWGNATFDDAGTAEASKFLLRLYVEKRDPKYKPALDKAIAVRPGQPVSDRRLAAALSAARRVRASRQARLHVVPHLQRRRGGGEHRLPGDVLPGARRRRGCSTPITRGMNAFIVTQQGRRSRVGAAVHARPEAGRRADLRAGRAGHAHDRHQHRAADEVLPADRRHEVPRARCPRRSTGSTR